MQRLLETHPSFYKDHDPEQQQCWFHLFDLEKDTEPIPEAELKPQGKHLQARPESIQDFLRKSNIQEGLVKEALSKSMVSEHEENKEGMNP